MPIDVMEVINAESVSQYVSGTPKTNLIGEMLFPRKKQVGIDITLIKGAKNKPVALRPSQFDVSVKLRSLKASVKEETKEMPFFKEAIAIKEKDRQNLFLAMTGKNTQWRDMILDNIYGDIKGLVDGADIQAERMRMQLLYQGAILVSTEDRDIKFDYGLPASHKEVLSGTAVWTDTVNSTPVEDIIRWQDKVEEDTGIKPTRAICTKKTFNYLKNNKSIRKDIDKTESTIITDKVLKKYLNDKLDLVVEIVSGNFIAEDGSTQLYFPNDVFTLIPEGKLGDTYYGTTPEEADLMSGNAAQVSIVRTGVAITTAKKIDPVTVITKVSQITLPSFERIEEIFIGTVK
ncbi:major capsid protein [Hathewaya massiliensis]|uniref:major capsid protein n=1 Tax=Hathewaya massiliensis TaxID=1964382 RepID=UPI001FAA090D|nr:major capsid protein [Hathewaya massiliensis]